VNVAEFLLELKRLDIRLSLDGDDLRCSAAAGALTPELRQVLRERKSEIVRFLHEANLLSAQQSAVVPLQANGHRIPVFAVPGHNGDVFCYRALSQSLGDDQPFFGLQPPGLDGRAAPLRSVEELAAFFAAQIHRQRPRGPYVIAGFCAGGATAFELARQLMRKGESIAFVALFGSPYPAFFGRRQQSLRWLRTHRALIARHLFSLLRRPRQELLHVARRIKTRPSPLEPTLALRAAVEKATLAAVRRYRPRLFAGSLYLFQPCHEWSGRQWLTRWMSAATAAEEYYGPEGTTGDSMLLPPNAGVFAQLFRQARDAHLADGSRRTNPEPGMEQSLAGDAHAA
jgi:thioesterase domain-containing protein